MIFIKAERNPKNPTVPLLILVLKIISGRLVLARVGNKSPTALSNLMAIFILFSSIFYSFFKTSLGVITSKVSFKSLSFWKLCLSYIKTAIVEKRIPLKRRAWEILLTVL